MFPERLETDRLVMRRFDREEVDLGEAAEAFLRSRAPSIERELRHLPDTPDDTLGETLERFEDAAEAWEAGERAEWAIRPKEGEPGAGEFAGTAVLTPLPDRRTAHTGVWLRKRFWGRGYSGERVEPLVEVAFDRLDVEVVSPACSVDNDASRRAIEKYVERLGGRYEGVLRNWIPMPDGRVDDVHRFSVTREEFERNRGGESAENRE